MSTAAKTSAPEPKNVPACASPVRNGAAPAQAAAPASSAAATHVTLADPRRTVQRSSLTSPANNRRTGILPNRRSVHSTVSSDTIKPPKNPTARLSGVTYNCKNGVRIASSHQVDSPTSISQA